MIITDAVEGFMIDLRSKKRSPNTLRHYEHKLRIWATWMAEQGVILITQITIAHLRAFMLYIEQVSVNHNHPGRVERGGSVLGLL